MELDLQLCYICGWELVKGAEAEHISSQLWKSDRKSQISPLSPRRSIEQRNPELKCVICHHNETFPLLSASLYINQKIAAYTPLPPHTTLATHNNALETKLKCAEQERFIFRVAGTGPGQGGAQLFTIWLRLPDHVHWIRLQMSETDRKCYVISQS